VLLPGICIAAAGPVYSVCCVANGELATLSGQTIACTKESATGRLLLRLICRRYHGFDAGLAESDDPFAAYLQDGTPCLVIGDKAIDAAEQAPIGAIWDLGLLWKELAGSGMVYAVWAVRRAYALAHPTRVQAVADALQASLAWGLERREAVIARAQATKPRAAGFYQTYYEALRFRFDDEARAALANFLGAAHEAGLLERAPALHYFDQAVQHV
jgi:chorismate dehydratase